MKYFYCKFSKAGFIKPDALPIYPCDTEVILKSCCGNAQAVWKQGAWHCEKCDKTIDFAQQLQLEIDAAWDKHLGTKKKCECGAEKAKTTHVSWCPKYNP